MQFVITEFHCISMFLILIMLNQNFIQALIFLNLLTLQKFRTMTSKNKNSSFSFAKVIFPVLELLTLAPPTAEVMLFSSEVVTELKDLTIFTI